MKEHRFAIGEEVRIVNMLEISKTHVDVMQYLDTTATVVQYSDGKWDDQFSDIYGNKHTLENGYILSCDENFRFFDFQLEPVIDEGREMSLEQLIGD